MWNLDFPNSFLPQNLLLLFLKNFVFYLIKIIDQKPPLIKSHRLIRKSENPNTILNLIIHHIFLKGIIKHLSDSIQIATIFTINRTKDVFRNYYLHSSICHRSKHVSSVKGFYQAQRLRERSDARRYLNKLIHFVYPALSYLFYRLVVVVNILCHWALHQIIRNQRYY